jgi:hypothetical protein
MQIVDPTHPALRGFEIVYRWESVQEEDFGSGVIVMFTASLIGFVVLFTLVICNSELMDLPPTPASSSRSSSSISAKSKRNRY